MPFAKDLHMGAPAYTVSAFLLLSALAVVAQFQRRKKGVVVGSGGWTGVK